MQTSSISRSICRSCRLKLLQEQTRNLSISSRRSNVPPEAPNYIDVPQTHQPDVTLIKRAKGTLPVPRELFPPQRPDKPSSEYSRNATMEKLPKNQKSPDTLPELKQWKLRMSEVRKKNLREGLKELHQRKESMARAIVKRSEHKQAQRAALIDQPEREDARLTNVSTPQSMHPSSNTPLPLSQEWEAAIYARKRANVAAQEADKAEVRKDALHTLYMNARSFITTEQQLLDAINKEFAPDKWSQSGLMREASTTGGRERNIWSEGLPMSVAEMLKLQDTQSEKGNVNARTRNAETDQARMKRIAEVLSGGKI